MPLIFVHSSSGDSLQDEGKKNPNCVVGATIDMGKTQSFKCNPVLKGKYVTVYLDAHHMKLAFCEVEVYGKKVSGLLNRFFLVIRF